MRRSLRPVFAAALAVAVATTLVGVAPAAKPKPSPHAVTVTVTLTGDPIPASETPPVYDPDVSGTATVNDDPATYTGHLEIGRDLPESRCDQCSATKGFLTVTTADGSVTFTLDPKRSYVTWTGGANREPGFHIATKDRLVVYGGETWHASVEGFYSRHAAFSFFDPSVGGFVYTTEPDAGQLTATLTPR